MGDERAPDETTVQALKTYIGEDEGVQADIPMKDVVAQAQKMYNVFHIIIKEGGHCSYDFDGVLDSWTALLGQRAIVLDDYTKLAEVIVSLIEVNEGKNAADVAASWSGDTSMVVANAVKDLTPEDQFDDAMSGVTRL